MRKLYIILTLVFLFFTLSSYALGDLMGMDNNIYAFVILMGVLLAFDLAADHFLEHKARFFNITKMERFKLSCYAIVIWMVCDMAFAAIESLINPDFYFTNYLYGLINPLVFASTAVMGIAVWFSLGYVLPEETAPVKKKNDENPAEPYLKDRKTSVDIAEQIRLEKEKQKNV